MKPRSNPTQMLSGYTGFAGLMLLSAGTLLLVTQPTDHGWWATRLLGLAALMLVAGSLTLRPVAGRRAWHKIFGWAALVAIVAHVTVVAGFQPAFWRWLTPAIPVEILAGLAAALAFVATLAIQRSTTLRQCLGPFRSRRTHRVAGCLLAVAAGAHIALIAGMGLVAALIVLGGLAFLLASSFLHERHLAEPAVTLGLFIVAIAGLAGGPLVSPRLATLRQTPIDHARFLHTDHTGLSCTGCHHNFVDQGGNENCLTCHKRISVSETMRIDRLFHTFCSDCHRMDMREGKKSGPADDCNGCHGQP
ncbi:cytochrome c3 family protein [Mesorhizobium sp. 1B3]|uniref:cytochrome c3 family protein n=1 Tax=Mesorhizobium sp. 1B3 TaxID=3243599 RepID=UPI003D9675BA